MKYGMDIQADNIIREEIISDLFWSEDFTLTVSSVNDAPVLLQPIECLEIFRGFSGCSNGVQYHI